MRLWFVLASMLLASPTAHAQCYEARNPKTGEAFKLCGGDMTPSRPPECDAMGCYFDELKKWRAAKEERESNLQRRAEEARIRTEAPSVAKPSSNDHQRW